MTTSDTTSKPPAVPTDRLALRPAEAARALGIGRRLLWSMTVSGEVPHVKVGRCTLYPVDALRDWLARKVNG